MQIPHPQTHTKLKGDNWRQTAFILFIHRHGVAKSVPCLAGARDQVRLRSSLDSDAKSLCLAFAFQVWLEEQRELGFVGSLSVPAF
jgi:hypothetical protein